MSTPFSDVAETPTADAPSGSVGEALEQASSGASLERTVARSAQIEQQIEEDPGRFRVLTGDRPTGNLHLGHYFGTLANRVALQRRGVETLILIADYQVIADRDGVGQLRERVYSLLADYLAIGLDPDKTTIFTHSSIPELNQLMLGYGAEVLPQAPQSWVREMEEVHQTAKERLGHKD